MFNKSIKPEVAALPVTLYAMLPCPDVVGIVSVFPINVKPIYFVASIVYVPVEVVKVSVTDGLNTIVVTDPLGALHFT